MLASTGLAPKRAYRLDLPAPGPDPRLRRGGEESRPRPSRSPGPPDRRDDPGGGGPGQARSGQAKSGRAKVQRPKSVSAYLALFSRRLELSPDQIAEIKPVVVQGMGRQKQLTKAAASLDSPPKRGRIQERTAVLGQARA